MVRIIILAISIGLAWLTGLALLFLPGLFWNLALDRFGPGWRALLIESLGDGWTWLIAAAIWLTLLCALALVSQLGRR